LTTTIATVANAGEFGLIRRIKQILPTVHNQNLIVGIGDDTAVIRLGDQQALLLSCDIQIENQHFRRDFISCYQLGRRALAVNLSDIAAMGGTPTFALVSLGLPRRFLLSDFEELYRGLRDEAEQFSTTIIGGNLSHSSENLIIDITILGEAAISNVVFRSGANVGDRIFVTGAPGTAASGLHVLQQFGKEYPHRLEDIVLAHLQPRARIEFAKKISTSRLANAMIDISDGLASDLRHIGEMSQVGAELYQSQLPLPNHQQEIEKISGQSIVELILNGGEDYELLFTVRLDLSTSQLYQIAAHTKVKITEIGRIVPASQGFHLITLNGHKQQMKPKGWDHFQQ